MELLLQILRLQLFVCLFRPADAIVDSTAPFASLFVAYFGQQMQPNNLNGTAHSKYSI
jgi:hypothetical protein